jgi:uncharacterized protein (DUF58 family)
MLDSKFYDTLSRLQLAMAHKSSLNMSGNRKSVQKGISAEFSDFREYMRGDDLRRLDWNVYARLDRMVIREYMEEKEAVVSVLLDTSSSMDYGKEKKAELAVELAAVASYLALNNMDRLILYDMKEMNRGFVLSGGRNAFPKALKWLEDRTFGGEVDMLAATGQMRHKGPGVTILISDFLHPALLNTEGGYEKVLSYLCYRRQRPIVLQTLAGEELHVQMEGTLNLIDMETDHKIRITMDAKAIAAYENELSRLTERMNKGCQRCGGAYVLCDTTRDRGQLIFEDLRVLYDI